MKAKKISKKLVLTKTTMAHLNVDEVNGGDVKGGWIRPGATGQLTWCLPACPSPSRGTCEPDMTCPCYTYPEDVCIIQP